MIKKHILKGTEEALERISEKVSYARTTKDYGS